MGSQPPAGDDATVSAATSNRGWRELYLTEDWWAVWIGLLLLALCAVAVWLVPFPADPAAAPFWSWPAKPGSWSDHPREALTVKGLSVLPGTGLVFLLGLVAFGWGRRIMGGRLATFVPGYCAVFLLALFAFVLAGQTVIKYYNLEYALWALLVGLLISHTSGTPAWLRSAACTEFYIKTGLVLMGAEIVFGRLLALGVPGICVAWVVTPIVLVVTFWFGQRILRIESPTLNIVLSADMSVCGVSAAIATSAACRAKRSELSLVIGMSLSFTVVMMILMPMAVRWMGLSNVLGGAWMGGTIDSTGAVAAAGAMLGDDAFQVAAAVKMIQNILIGVVAFLVAVYWVTWVERGQSERRPSAWEIWRRFPKFILGFVAASVVFSLLASGPAGGQRIVDDVTEYGSSALRNWFFCLAFVSIGLETNFRELAANLKGGKPLWLYVIGQSFNLCLTLLMAWLMFEVVFPHAADSLQQ
jgi:uncharacterized membrane protein YadS